jgi:putative aminopeptidase FrvX
VKTLIRRLVETYGPSGREGAVRELVQSEVEPFTDQIEISPMGGLHAFRNRGGKRKVMLAAHMDEIGVVISHIDAHGFARFQPVGSLQTRILLGQRVQFAGDVLGIIGVDLDRSSNRSPTHAEHFIDFGVKAGENCPVSVGDFGVLERAFLDLGERLVGKALDDRVGVAILIETLRQLKDTPHEVQFAFTVQEQVGQRGALTSAYALDPDLGIAVDVTATGDTPKGWKLEPSMGEGPAIKVRDRRTLSDPRIVRLLERRAQAAAIRYQKEIRRGGGTDAAAIQLSRAGVPVGCLSIPTRYLHTPSEMVDFGDVQAAVALLLEVLTKPIEFLEGEG